MPDIDLMGATYPDVPAVTLPSGNGTATFYHPDEIDYAASPTSGGNAVKSNGILYAAVDSTSTSTVFTATVDGLTELYDGACVMLHNGVVTSAKNFTINVNGLGAKKCYSSLTNATQETTIFNVAYTLMFVYSTALDGGNGGWWVYRGIDTNTTYTPVKLGFGYGHCTTAASTAAKAVAISGYVLNTGGIVSVLFDHDVQAGATLNVTSKGAKAIYHKGAAITDGIIKAGDTATFMYSGQYHLVSIDRDAYTLPPATTSTLGGVKVGSGLSVAADGTLSSDVDTGMVILEYGVSTWADLIEAITANRLVYCRVGQRMAFLAYLGGAAPIPTTLAEFQYYRSVSNHTDSQQGDEVYVYTLRSDNSWTTVTRQASTRVVAGDGLSSAYSNGTITLSAVGGGSGGIADGSVTTAKLADGAVTDAKLDPTGILSSINTGFEKNGYAWQKGGLSNMEITDQKFRAVTTDVLTVADDVIVKNTNSTFIFEVQFTLDDVLNWTGWVTANENHAYKIPAGASFRIVVRKATENYATLSNAELQDIANAIYLSTPLRETYLDIERNTSAANYGLGVFDPRDFRIGTWYASGSFYKETARVCSKSTFAFPYETRISVKAGYRFGMNIYDSQGGVAQNISFGTREVTVPANTKFTITIDNGDTSATANVALYAAQVNYRTSLGMQVDKANEVGERHYSGINIKPKQNGFNTEQLPWRYSSPTTSGTFTPQAMSYYGGVAFKCWNNSLIQLYDFSDGTKIAEYAATSGHGNTMDFSNEFYAAGDEFPLAYIADDDAPIIHVNRLTRSGATHVRDLVFDAATVGYYVGCAVDAANNRLVLMGYREQAHASNPNGTNCMLCTVWDLDELTQVEGGYEPELIKQFKLPFMATTQDKCFYENRFYAVSSKATSSADTVIYVIDLGLESVVATLSDIPYKNYETEGIFWADSDMYVNGNGITKYSFV